jgi:hypothetical protein
VLMHHCCNYYLSISPFQFPLLAHLLQQFIYSSHYDIPVQSHLHLHHSFNSTITDMFSYHRIHPHVLLYHDHTYVAHHIIVIHSLSIDLACVSCSCSCIVLSYIFVNPPFHQSFKPCQRSLHSSSLHLFSMPKV